MNPFAVVIHDDSPRRRRAGRVVLAAVLGAFAAAPSARAGSPGTIQYNRDVRSILAENCFACHGPDSAARKADLRLDRRDDAIKAEAIVPGDSKNSELVVRLFSDDPDEVMPPASSKKTLTASEKDVLKRWIDAGADYQPHWSFLPPTRPQPPAVRNAAWVRNPIDQFVLAKLEDNGLSPAPEADRRTLARRLSLDLTGLPPAPELVDAFIADPSADAYERFVDRLISTERWGEHRARYWLDAARYADTHGIHMDNFRENWVYREWVVNAFNRNLPFDRFTIEQLAGDLLPDRTVDQQIASGFNRCNITSSEGGAIDEEYLVLYARDRTETTSQVWMGLTTGCAVCHDHKFDPISQKEFYALSAFFNNTTQRAMDGNIKDTPPILPIPQPEDRARFEAVGKEIESARARLDARRQAARGEFDGWLASAAAKEPASSVPSDALALHVPLTEGTGATVRIIAGADSRRAELGDKIAWAPGRVSEKALVVRPAVDFDIPEAGDYDKDEAFSYGAWVKAPKRGANTGPIFARMDESNAHRGWDLWFENGRVGTHVIHTWPDDALKVLARTELKPGAWHHVFVAYDGKGKAAGVAVYIDGKPQPVEVQADRLKNTIKTRVPLTIGRRSNSTRLAELALQDVRVYRRALSAAEVASIATGTRAAWLAARPAASRSKAETEELFTWYLSAVDPEFSKLSTTVAALDREQNEIRARGTVAHVMQERNDAPMAHILFRGEYDKRRDAVKPETPAALPPMPADLPRNRLGLAQWLLRPEHPLTARVNVNRFWQEVFGAGLVRTSGDFGVTGELPSHPELLDWLAVDFRENGWDVKRFFKMLVTSSTYRQSAASTPLAREKDPANRLLSRGPRFRMDAEMVRDYALASSGLLVTKLGGPSVKPYQPDGVWEAVTMIGSNTREYKRDNGDALYRRSLYTFWKRSAPPASLEIFNAPSREFCTVRRERTNTPLQALVTLNDPQFVEAARRLAERTLKDGGAAENDRVRFLAARLLARPLSPNEEPVVLASLADLSAYYQGHLSDANSLISLGESKPDPALDPQTLAAWTMLANEMMNLDEVLNK